MKEEKNHSSYRNQEKQVMLTDQLWWSKIRKASGYLLLMVLLLFFSGCATGGSYKLKPLGKGVSVTRLKDGRQAGVWIMP